MGGFKVDSSTMKGGPHIEVKLPVSPANVAFIAFHELNKKFILHQSGS